jgi:ATP-dependent RNA helicase DeaD
MEKFTKLGLSKELTDVLKQHGFKEPSEIQEKAIPLALEGRDVIGGAMTGSGKTLVFASAIIENLKPNKEIQALILVPTRELAEQVATSIRNFGKNKKLKVLAIYGGMNINTQIRDIYYTDVLVATPGRLIDHLNRRTLRLNNVKFLVLDEVDRMFDMGFRRDVESIIHECPKERQTLLFSATISQEIDYLSKKYTKNPVEVSVKSHVDPSKLTQVYYDVPDYQKFSLLVNLLKKENADLVMVFCNTRRNVDFISENLIKNGINAKAIHGGVEQNKRIKVLDEFHNKGLGVLVCTDVASRGLDIKGVTHVYNYEVPSDTKDYIHRIGRTARAGKDGKAITILASRDYENFRNLLSLKDTNIASEKLPEIEMVRVSLDSGRRNRFSGRENNRERDENRDPSRGSRGGRSSNTRNSPGRGNRSSSMRNNSGRRPMGRRY